MNAEDGSIMLVVTYHRIATPERDRWRLSVSPRHFESHVRFLSEYCNPIRLTELAQQVARGDMEAAVAITFDDGYADNLCVALPVLQHFQVPATFFISGDGAAIERTFWWEQLDAAAHTLQLDDDTLRRLHQYLASAPVDERNMWLSRLPSPPVSLPNRLTSEQLAALASSNIVDVGAHGWCHRAYPSMSIQQQRDDIARNVQVLQLITGARPSLFAYPFGWPSAGGHDVLAESGISAAFTVSAEPITPRTDVMAIPRLTIEDVDIDRFARLIAHRLVTS